MNDNKFIGKLLLLATVFVVVTGSMLSCADDNVTSEYCTRYHCYFRFNTTWHNACPLNSCLNRMSPGMFCVVYQKMQNDVKHLNVTLYGGQTDDVALTTEEERRVQYSFGADNGLIIGCSTLNGGDLYAFDAKCPNCLKVSEYVTLKWYGNASWVKCDTCKRSYDLNNSGFVVEGESGDKLLRYRSSYDGTYLLVTN